MNPSQTTEYFQQPNNYFWQWKEGITVIEWTNGNTICYRDDLLGIMRSLNDIGVPSIGVMLLVLAACNDSWEIINEDCSKVLYEKANINSSGINTSGDEPLAYYYVKQAITAMDLIAQLPNDLRKGNQRIHLLHEIISESKMVIKAGDVVDIADELIYESSDRMQVATKEISRQQFIDDVSSLARIREKYTTVQQLELKLRTGLTAIPLPAPIELPKQKPTDLLQELLEEPKTTGISRLAKKIIAALNIPMHLQRSGGQSYGGISDITNRGNFDRLLLSELANDDTMLMTRLVNNEALYLRREEPPHNPKTKRVLLIDSTIKLWGVPRVFAVSAAIACTQNIHHGEAIEAYILGGNDFTETDLTTRQGVIQSLQQLDPALHCTTALSACLESVSDGSQTDSILITSEETVHEIAFQKWVASSGDSPGFLITVNRNGSLHFNSLVNGHLKQLTTAKFDLEELLFRVEPVKHQHNKIDGRIKGLPAFFKEEKSPLLFPAIHIRKSKSGSYHFYDKKAGVLGITETQRLLRWQSKDKGAEELSIYIEPGKTYLFVSDKLSNVCLLVFSTKDQNKTIRIYYVDIHTNDVQNWKVDIQTDHYHAVLLNQKLFVNGSWQMAGGKSVAVFDCKKGIIEEYRNYKDCRDIFELPDKPLSSFSRTLDFMPVTSRFSNYINNGYTVLIRIKKIFIDTSNQLCIDGHHFSVPSKQDHFITLKEGTSPEAKYAARIREEKFLEINPQLWLMQFLWPDGSTATVDSRGLLHLKSSDASLPEVTMVLIQGKTTACWASDDTLCGSEYFRKSILKMMPVDFFYTKYITPIIQRILQS